MQIGFVCSDGAEILHENCLKGCRMGDRCLSRQTLEMLADVREWNGKPSTTQLIKGTREAYLTIVTPFYVKPKSLMFALLGTKHHAKRETKIIEDAIQEKRYEDDDASGQLDFCDLRQVDEDHWVGDLYDYKTWGSYKVQKALGLYKEDVPTGEVYKSGARKGQEKTRKEIRQDSSKVDLEDAMLQLNHYRMLIEKKVEISIDRLIIEATVRDGNTYSAFGRGVMESAYLIPVPKMEDSLVESIFKNKAEALQKALATKELPMVCSDKERWGDKKCQKYCHVSHVCDHALSLQKSEEEVEGA